MGGSVSTSIGNRYRKKIWVKYDVEKKYVQMEDYTIEGQLGFSEISIGAGVSVSRKYDWNKIQMDFTPIKSGDFKELTIDCKDSKVVYITIVAEDGEIICKTWPMHVANSIVVTDEGGLRMAEENDPLKAHKKYDKLVNDSCLASDNKAQRKQTTPSSTKEQKKKTKTENPGVSASSENLDTNLTRMSINSGGLRSELRAEKSGSLNAKMKGDKHSCSIVGMTVTHNGTIVMTDYKNKNLKYFSTEDNVLSVLGLPSRPTTITTMTATTIVVAAANNKIYRITPTDQSRLTITGESQLLGYILAITHYNGYLVVTCMTEPRCTRMIDIQGNQKWSVSTDDSGKELFTWPCGVVSTSINGIDVIVVSSYGNDTLTLLDAADGRLIRTIELDGKMPSGITLDNNGNMYNCYWQTDEICVWSKELKKNKILLSRDKLEKSPRFIVYCDRNDCLYIAYDDNDKIDCFQLIQG